MVQHPRRHGRTQICSNRKPQPPAPPTSEETQLTRTVYNLKYGVEARDVSPPLDTASLRRMSTLYGNLTRLD